MSHDQEITALLVALGHGEPSAMDRLLPAVYGELQRLAHGQRRSFGDEGPGTISLVHETYLKLVDQTQVEWQHRAQFFYLASRAMRSILIDDARRRARAKRAPERDALPLDDAVIAAEERSADLLALDEMLDRLRQSDERLADIVQCRFFGGLTVEETGEAMGISAATVKRGWILARAWLHRAMHGTVDATS